MSQGPHQRLIDEVLQLQGWDAVDLENDLFRQLKEQREAEGQQLASLFHQAFVQNDAGAVILRHLVRVTLARPIVGPNDSQFAAGIREGRADLVRQILLNISLAESQ